MPTTQQYQEQLGSGSGTVAKALAHLHDVGAVATRGRGHLGTVITAIEPGLLWQQAERPALRVALTPPGAPDQYGLTTGLRLQLLDAGVSIELVFLRGANRRLKCLRARQVDVAVMSTEAARSVSEAIHRRLSVVDGDPIRYYSPDLLVVVSRRTLNDRRLRVGIDRDSFDHVVLTETEFAGEDVDFVDCVFSDVPAAILRGDVDTGVWHRALTLISPELAGLNVRSMRTSPGHDGGVELLGTALCTRATDGATINVLARVDMVPIRAIQDEFLAMPADTDEFQSRLWMR